MSPDFFWGAPWLRKWHYLQKFPWKKVATHLKIFLGVLQNFWHGRNACDILKIQPVLEDQCVMMFSFNMLDYPILLEGMGKVGYWATWYDFH